MKKLFVTIRVCSGFRIKNDELLIEKFVNDCKKYEFRIELLKLSAAGTYAFCRNNGRIMDSSSLFTVGNTNN
jgi:hypothetical protein